MNQHRRNRLWAVLLLLLNLLWLGGCASSVTQDLSQKAKNAVRWELITVYPEFIGKSDFLAVSEVDDQALDTPLIFDIDIIKLAPGEHRLKIVLGKLESGAVRPDPGSADWQAELGILTLEEPDVPKAKHGRNYLVASFDKIYTINTQSPRYMQRWVVHYPQTIEDDKKWSMESLDPQTTDSSEKLADTQEPPESP
ncbi:MAG: hypothetical protein AAF975_01600 [Spirochaetota bacterium]